MGKSLKIFKTYLSNRTQYVDFDGTLSDTLQIRTGVPQGSILGPLLFLVYINDICHSSSMFDFIVYADDTTLHSSLDKFNGSALGNAALSININEELNKVHNWVKANKLSLNVRKTKFMIFHMPQKNISVPHLEIDGTEIEYIQNFNFLGIIIDNNLNWNSHLDNLEPSY